jgi:hypothetical protein
MGGAAILNTFMSLKQTPVDGARGLLQMCFSTLSIRQGSFQYSSSEPNSIIPTHAEPQDDLLPETFFEWISVSEKMVSEADRPSAELIQVLARFVQLTTLVRTQPHFDGQPRTSDTIRQALAIDVELEAWERRQQGIWAVVEERVPDSLPPEAVFEGCYHIYDDTYIARVWNHYRWARIMVNQLLLECIDRFPTSSGSLITPEQQQRSLECIRRLARDTLVSVPTHYRHPSLQPAHWEYFDKTKFGAAVGVAGIPTLLFGIKVAACAPGLPDYYRTWALGILETVYRRTGMFQAKVLAGFVRGMVEHGSSSSCSSSPSSSSVGGQSQSGVHSESGHGELGTTWVTYGSPEGTRSPW